MLFILKAVSFIIGHLPIGLASFLGRSLGGLAFMAAKRHRRTAIENLTRAFGESLTKVEIEAVARKVFENLGLMVFEFLRIPWLKPESVNGYIECTGIENLKKALDKKKGVIFFTAHFGNWEMMAAYYGLKGFPVDVVVRDLDSPAFEEFVRWVRMRSGNRIVSKNRAMRRLLKLLAENGIAGILLDQNVASNEGVFVDFFGTPACTNKGPAMLAATSGAAVVPTFIVRTGRTHRIFILEEVELSDTGNKTLDAKENTARCTKIIEDMVRRYPDQWFWVHRRWKTRPQ